jgi:hypothetical protein
MLGLRHKRAKPLTPADRRAARGPYVVVEQRPDEDPHITRYMRYEDAERVFGAVLRHADCFHPTRALRLSLRSLADWDRDLARAATVTALLEG